MVFATELVPSWLLMLVRDFDKISVSGFVILSGF